MSDTTTIEVHLEEGDWSSHLAAETRRGLASPQPWIPPVWFYDELGSTLFEEITRLPEYYPTRAERSILATQRNDHPRRLAEALALGRTHDTRGENARRNSFGVGPNSFAVSSKGDETYLFSGNGTNLTGYLQGYEFAAADKRRFAR